MIYQCHPNLVEARHTKYAVIPTPPSGSLLTIHIMTSSPSRRMDIHPAEKRAIVPFNEASSPVIWFES